MDEVLKVLIDPLFFDIQFYGMNPRKSRLWEIFRGLFLLHNGWAALSLMVAGISKPNRISPNRTSSQFCQPLRPSGYHTSRQIRSLALARCTVVVLFVAVLGEPNTAGAQQLPEVSIAAGTSSVSEGTAATFTLSRTGATTAELIVTVSVTETGSMLAGTPGTTVTLAVGDSSTTLSVATDDDTVVEDSSTVTVTITDDFTYTVTVDAGTDTVEVTDDDAAVFDLTVSPSNITDITEADTEAVTMMKIAITNGVTFARPQSIDIALSGSATVGSDYTFTGAYGRPVSKPFSLTLPAGESEVSGIITAVNDTRDENDETITINVTHDGTAIGTQQDLTIADDDVPPLTLSALQVTTTSDRGMYPVFNADTFHYAVGCDDTLTVGLSAQEPSTRVAVNGRQVANQDGEVELTGLDGESDIVNRAQQQQRCEHDLYCPLSRWRLPAPHDEQTIRSFGRLHHD